MDRQRCLDGDLNANAHIGISGLSAGFAPELGSFDLYCDHRVGAALGVLRGICRRRL